MLLALYRHKEILVNSSLKATKKKKLARAISINQVSDLGPSWPSCFVFVVIADTNAVVLFLLCGEINIHNCFTLKEILSLQTDKQAGRQKYGQTDGQTDRQAEWLIDCMLFNVVSTEFYLYRRGQCTTHAFLEFF